MAVGNPVMMPAVPGQGPTRTSARPLSEAELLAYLLQCEAASASFGRSALSLYQVEAIDRYYGRDYGTETLGRSTARTFDTRDLINWAMPSLLRIFGQSEDLISIASTDQVAVSDDMARQMSDGLNHIFWVDNRGFQNVHDYLFDGLLQRVGIMQVRWMPPEEEPPEFFKDLDLNSIRTQIQRGYQMRGRRVANEAMPLDHPGQRFDVEMQRIKPGRIDIRSVPPEEFSWESTARGLDDSCRYQQRIERVFLADVQQKYPQKAAELEAAGAGSMLTIGDAQARWLARHWDSTSSDRLIDNDPGYARRVLLCHEFLKIDFDGDGIIELREVFRVGQTILYNEPVALSEYYVWSPIRVPHTVAGLALADDAIENQGVQTSLLRRALDSLAASTNPRIAYDETKLAEGTLDALTDNRLAGIVPVLGNTAEALSPITVPDVSPSALTWMQYFKTRLEGQTGVGPSSQGLDPNDLTPKSPSGVATNLIQTGQAARLETMARQAADGLSQIFKAVISLVVMHQDGVRQIQRQGKPTLVLDPSQWSSDASVTVNVAMAAATRSSQLQQLGLIANKQEQILLQLGPQNPLVGLDQYSNTLTAMVEAMGFRNPERFFKLIPLGAQVQMPPPPPNPKQQEAQQKAQTDAMQMQLEQQRLNAESAADNQRKDIAMQAEIARKNREMEMDIDLKREIAANELKLRQQVAYAKLETDLKVGLARARAGANGSGGGGGGSYEGGSLEEVNPS